MSSLSDAVATATAPYTGWTYYATGPGYYNPAQTAAYIEDLNNKFKLNLTPQEIASGIQQFGDWHRNLFGYDVSQSPNQQTWVNQNGVGNFTDLSDPFAIARESVGNVLRARGLPETAVQSNFYAPLQAFSQNSTDTYQKAADGLNAAQRAAWKSQNPDLGGMGFGTIISDLLSNPVVQVAGSLFTAGAMGAFGGGAALAGEGAALGSGISAGAGGITGATAGAAGATGITGGIAGLTGGQLAATTGGLLVGSEGLLGSTGNAIGDQVLNSAGQNALTSAATGRDPLQGAAQGAVGGLIGSARIGSSVASGLGATGDAATAITSGVNAGAGAGAMTAINGGSFSDILSNAATAGVSQGAGSYVSSALDSGTNTVDRGAGGAVAGGLNAALTGGNIGAGLLTSGLAGAAGGLATDLGASPSVAGVVQGVTGGLVGSALQPDAVVNPLPTATSSATPSATTPEVSSISFSDVIPHFIDAPRSTEWGNRLIQAGRI